jgi:hypothetical protein
MSITKKTRLNVYGEMTVIQCENETKRILCTQYSLQAYSKSSNIVLY